MRRFPLILLLAALIAGPATAQYTSAQLGASSSSTDYSNAAVTTPVVLMPASTGGRYFWIQNQSASAYCYWRVGGTANIGQPSRMLPPLAAYETPASYHPTGAVSVTCSASTPVQAEGW